VNVVIAIGTFLRGHDDFRDLIRAGRRRLLRAGVVRRQQRGHAERRAGCGAECLFQTIDTGFAHTSTPLIVLVAAQGCDDGPADPALDVFAFAQ
jgi:hypothetical protein